MCMRFEILGSVNEEEEEGWLFQYIEDLHNIKGGARHVIYSA